MTREPTNTEHGTTRWIARLSAYLDGDVTGGERARLEDHLAGCEECRGLLSELRAVVHDAPGLRAGDSEPTADLWPGIQDRLRPRAPRRNWLEVFVPGRTESGMAWLRPAVAVAVLILAVAAGLLLLPRGGPAPKPVERAAGERVPAAPALDSRPLEASREYYDTLSRLERAARVGLAGDPRVVEVIEENLEVLDMAIAQYADALAEQPGDARLATRLEAARQRKIEVLKQAVDLAAEAGN